MLRFFALSALVTFTLVCCTSTAGAAEPTAPADKPVFRAGAYAIDATPTKSPIETAGSFEKRLADRVHDPLYSRALVLDDGTTRLAIVVVDVALLPEEDMSRARQSASQASGIPPDHILIAATHTHSAPSLWTVAGVSREAEYARFLVERIAQGLKRACDNLAPARVGWAVTEAGEFTHCRRWIFRSDRVGTDPFGQQTVRANMHPGFQNPATIGPAGPADPGLIVLSVQSPEGRPIALLANFSMHYVGSPAISSDYYGQFCRETACRLGVEAARPPLVAIMSQGTSGDLGWQDYSRPPYNAEYHQYAKAIAGIVEKAYKRIEYRAWAPLVIREKDMVFSVRRPDEGRLAWACLETGAEPKIVDAVLGLLEDVSGKSRRKTSENHGPYAQAVLASKPVAYWRMGEFTGPTAGDSTGNHHPAAYEDLIAFYLPGPQSPNFCGGQAANRCAHFAGGRMKAAIPGLGDTYSVEFWFWNGMPKDARAVTGYLFSRGLDGTAGASGDHLAIGGTHAAVGRLAFCNGGDELAQLLAGKTEIKLKTWYHVVLVRDGSRLTVFLNGNPEPEIGGRAEVRPSIGQSQWFFGGRSDSFANFEGKIDEVAVYPRALSPAEAAAHYQAAGLERANTAQENRDSRQRL